MARKLKIDRILFTATLLLVCVSVVMVYSASAVIALERFQQPYLFLTKQALWSVLGLAVLGVATRVDYRTYRNEAFIWCLLALVVLMLVAVLFSAPVNGTRRWFGVGGLGIQ
ncbi:MAG TPA: FtsW/RodA/SpoVE family cell cycle protein, partial [Vicinamibacterales bacterium]|nr:FtsW/RodA/SpoVE family cell cycle protein [Vicinamibacterales bacterium]